MKKSLLLALCLMSCLISMSQTQQFFTSDKLSSNQVTSICQDKTGYIWVGTSGDGLYCLTDKAKRVAHYEHPAIVTSFFEDTEGDIWVTSSSSGVSLLNRKTKRIVDHAIKTSSGALTTAHDIESDIRGRMWVGSMGNGLYCFDKQSNKVLNGCFTEQ